MRVCHFGVSDPSYSRNRVIVEGLRQNGVEVIECNEYSPPVSRTLPAPLDYAKKYVQLMKRHARLSYDIMVTSYAGQLVMPIAKSITRRPVVLDAFLGMYEMFLDFESRRNQLSTLKQWYCLDKFSLQSAELILSDTDEHIRYFCREFGISENKFRRILVGSDDRIFFPRATKVKNDTFLIMFWGSFLPLQGIEYIVHAAKLLEPQGDIRFEIIGSGRTFGLVLNLSERLKSKNISFTTDWISYTDLPNYIAKADVCLGIFGNTPKSRRVIPNKVFETLAMRKPLITEDSPAAREILASMENCILCKSASPKSIAESITLLKNDENLRNEIATKGHNLFKARLTPRAIGAELKKCLGSICA